MKATIRNESWSFLHQKHEVQDVLGRIHHLHFLGTLEVERGEGDGS